MRVAALALALVVIAFTVVWLAAAARWRSAGAALVARLTRGPASSRPTRFQRAELAGLPPLVVRYLSQAIPEGTARVRIARVTSRGELRMSEAESSWRPFRAGQTFATARAGFVWDARIHLAPGLDAWVRDALVEGQGSMRASLLGLVPLVHAVGTPELAASALHRYLGESFWFPIVLLPENGVTWEAVDDSTARVTLADTRSRVSLLVHFGADGLPSRLETPERFRDVHGVPTPTPWRVHFRRWEGRGPFLVPVEAEVEWVLPAGAFPYWRGVIESAEYEPPTPHAGVRTERLAIPGAT